MLIPTNHLIVIVFLCQECAAPSAPGTEAKSPGDAQNFAPGQEGLKAGIIGPELKK
jgi:hypothetical protein